MGRPMRTSRSRFSPTAFAISARVDSARYHTFTTFSADLTAGASSRQITAYFKNSKVPVWAFREVERPVYQIPLEVIVKEIAAKLNVHVFGRVASAETVNKIAASIASDRADAASEEYLKVLELGYTNNPAAVELLVRLTNREETLMRASAISAPRRQKNSCAA